MVFPGGKTKAFTLSYDDGVVQDRRLAELFRKYGLKCTFNLNSEMLGCQGMLQRPGNIVVDITKIDAEEIPLVYQTHEIGGHGLRHMSMESMPAPLAMHEIIVDKQNLEQMVGRPVTMFAYPFGAYDSSAVNILSLAGYQGARTANATHRFDIPPNFLIWDPTCRHADPQLMDLAKQFVEDCNTDPQLFYVWGHSYELDWRNDWNIMEEFCAFMSQYAAQVWFATNGEVMDYVNAFRRLEYSADGSMIRNPNALDVSICTGDDCVILPAGQVTHLSCRK